MFLIVGGEGSSSRNASRDESVEAGDKSVEAGDESIEAGEKTPQSCYNKGPYTMGNNDGGENYHVNDVLTMNRFAKIMKF